MFETKRIYFVQQFYRDYGNNQQAKNMFFIKTVGNCLRNFKQISDNLRIVLKDQHKHYQDTILRKNLLDFIKYMINMQQFDLKIKQQVDFIDEIFNVFVGKALERYNCEQLQIASVMLLIRNIQDSYLDSLIVSTFHLTPNYPNLALQILQKLLYKIIQILEGGTKGPQVSIHTIQLLCQKSFQPENIYKISYTNQQDYVNFMLINQYTIYIIRNFTSIKNSKIQVHNNIWVDQLVKISENQIIGERSVNVLFGFMTELCLVNKKMFLDIFEEEENFDRVLQYSRDFALRCQKINKFWETYLEIRQDMLGRSLQKFNAVKIVNFFSNCFYTGMSDNLLQIDRKLQVIDNFIRISNFKSDQNQLKLISNLKDNLNLAYNPQTQRTKQIMFCSFQALYTKIYKIQQDNPFFSILQDLQTVTNKLLSSPLHTRFNNSLQYLNLLPFIKILILKSQTVLLQNQCFQTIIKFLFIFDTHSNRCLEDFIKIICQKFSKIIQSTSSKQEQQVLYLYGRVNSVIQYTIANLQKQANQYYDIGSHIRSIDNLIKIIKTNPMGNIHKYTMQLFKIIQIRKQCYDKDLHILLSKLIKTYKLQPSQAFIQFQTLKNIIVQNKRVFYLELIFDLAQSNYHNDKICQSMTKSKYQLNQMCQYSPKIEDYVRKILYNITIQSVFRNLHNFSQVVQSIGQLVTKFKFKGSQYRKNIQILSKQRRTIEKLNIQLNEMQNILKLIYIMLDMIRHINDSLQQNNQSTNAQKSQICHQICIQLTFYFQKFLTKLCKYFSQFQIYNLVQRLKTTVQESKLAALPSMIKAIKLLTKSYIDLQVKKNLKSQNRAMKKIEYKNIIDFLLINQEEIHQESRLVLQKLLEFSFGKRMKSIYANKEVNSGYGSNFSYYQ